MHEENLIENAHQSWENVTMIYFALLPKIDPENLCRILTYEGKTPSRKDGSFSDVHYGSFHMFYIWFVIMFFDAFYICLDLFRLISFFELSIKRLKV